MLRVHVLQETEARDTDEDSPIAVDSLVGGSGGVGSEHTIQDTGVVADFYLFKEVVRT